MKLLAIISCFFFLSACSVTYEYKDFSNCKSLSDGVEFMASVRSSSSNRGGVNYYGEPYDVRFRLRSEAALGVDLINVRLTDSDGGHIRDYSGEIKNVNQSDVYYYWYVLRGENLPYTDIGVSAEVSGEELNFKFDCRLYTDYKKYNGSLLDVVLGGV